MRNTGRRAGTQKGGNDPGFRQAHRPHRRGCAGRSRPLRRYCSKCVELWLFDMLDCGCEPLAEVRSRHLTSYFRTISPIIELPSARAAVKDATANAADCARP